MDGISAKMGHFVVDSFCPKKMQINVEKHKININCEATHRLPGVPCGDVTIESMGKLKKGDESVRAWRNRYKCHGQERCKENILDKLTGEIDFSKINWCAYILDSMKGCKKRWKSNDRSVPFSGPLAILTLMYVDSIECKGIKMDKNTNPISFWNMSRLKERQKWEIENGGFGKGKFKRFSKVIVDDEGDIGYFVRDEIEVLEKVFDVLQKQKNLFDSKFGRLFENHPQRQEVLELKAKYDLLMHSTGKKVVQSEAGVSKTNEQIQSVLEVLANNSRSNDENESDNDGENENNDKEEAEDQESENDNSTGVDQDWQEEPGDSEDNAADDHDPQETEDSEDAENGHEKNGNGANSEDNAGGKNVEKKFLGELVESDAVTVSLEHGEIGEINNFKDTAKEGNTLEEPNSEIVYNAPPFSIGLTQLESNNEELDTEKVDKQQELSVTEEGDDESTFHGNKSEYVYDGPPFSIGLTQLESQYCADETKQMEESNMEKRTDAVESSDIRGKGKVAADDEKYRSPTSPYRLFCDTDVIFDWMMKDKETEWPKRMERFILNMNRAVYWNPALMDLRGIDMVFIPMLEHDHYYLIVFELKHTAISVIDNSSDAYPLVHLNDHENYFQKDSAYKVVRML
ncbi:hypothetical protein L1987_77869 [Smallanthus sonchifolius]|uniref:Uncharacterized protein n=1 Tax=Smallanthus sonchifolius TaxID=185202 RepID=A0ACB8ZBA4_9ASTR|nr:hypothetical protein L1987_77869 [Smallanthus sonchifolius]